MNIHSQLSSVMLVCKNAIVIFWNALWNKNNNKYCAFFNTAPLHFMEKEAHFVPLICPCKAKYVIVKPHHEEDIFVIKWGWGGAEAEV